MDIDVRLDPVFFLLQRAPKDDVKDQRYVLRIHLMVTRKIMTTNWQKYQLSFNLSRNIKNIEFLRRTIIHSTSYTTNWYNFLYLLVISSHRRHFHLIRSIYLMHLQTNCNCFLKSIQSLNLPKINQEANSWTQSFLQRFYKSISLKVIITNTIFRIKLSLLVYCWIFCRWGYCCVDPWALRGWSFFHNSLQKDNKLIKLCSVCCSSF